MRDCCRYPQGEGREGDLRLMIKKKIVNSGRAGGGGNVPSYRERECPVRFESRERKEVNRCKLLGKKGGA